MTKEEFIKKAKENGYSDATIKSLIEIAEEAKLTYKMIPLVPQMVPGYEPHYDKN